MARFSCAASPEAHPCSWSYVTFGVGPDSWAGCRHRGGSAAQLRAHHDATADRLRPAASLLMVMPISRWQTRQHRAPTGASWTAPARQSGNTPTRSGLACGTVREPVDTSCNVGGSERLAYPMSASNHFASRSAPGELPPRSTTILGAAHWYCPRKGLPGAGNEQRGAQHVGRQRKRHRRRGDHPETSSVRLSAHFRATDRWRDSLAHPGLTMHTCASRAPPAPTSASATPELVPQSTATG